MTGPQLYERAGGVLASHMLNEAGNVYTASRYDNYLSDYLFYLNLEDEVESPYHVPDTWENYEAIKFNLDEDFQYWQEHISR
ncbi:hypothetical protein GCM10010912_54840 [Paenibacillus albidus]|uniref:Uncharacterized protein n=1 Tax=Paenibacillus albidus TaxID=2041023 RepID=A0A917CZ72_9BACL|nr:hypothetical protein [Paenibacillus albidus]GGG03139.1 hypothetical protein GCM10010912_54840 [Paenibacillus albidus]